MRFQAAALTLELLIAPPNIHSANLAELVNPQAKNAAAAATEKKETRGSLLLDLLAHILVNAPDLSSGQLPSEYKHQNGALSYAHKFTALGDNFELTINLSPTAVNYIATAQHLSKRNNIVKTPLELIKDIAGRLYIDGLIESMQITAHHYYLISYGSKPAVLLQRRLLPYDLEKLDGSNPIVFQCELTRPTYKFLRLPANELLTAALGVAKADIINAEGEKERALQPVSEKYGTAVWNMDKALVKFKRTT